MSAIWRYTDEYEDALRFEASEDHNIVAIISPHGRVVYISAEAEAKLLAALLKRQKEGERNGETFC